MLIAAVAIIVAIVLPVFGGRPSNLLRLRLRHSWLIGLALGVQVLILVVFDDAPEGLLKSIHLATYAAIVAFLIVNRAVPWMWMVTLGTLANLTVIAANGGVMPASRRALAAAGLEPTDDFSNSAVIDHPRLRFLGDVFATPDWLPLANVFSIGDVLLFVGLVPMILAISRVPDGAERPYLHPADDDDHNVDADA